MVSNLTFDVFIDPIWKEWVCMSMRFAKCNIEQLESYFLVSKMIL